MEQQQFNDLRGLMTETRDKVGQIHTTIFGAEGQGGVLRDVAELKKHKEEMTVFKAKLVGVVLAGSTVASFIGSKFSSWLGGGGK